MNTLDNPAAPTTNTPIWNTVLRYGAYCGVIIIVFSMIMYLMDVNLMTISGMLMFYGSVFIAGFVMAAIAMRYQRDQLDSGLISYGKALAVGLLVVMIGMFISSLWSYILVNFIDPEYVNHLKEQFIATWGERMPQDALDKALEGFDKSSNFFESLKSGLIGGAIFGLIVGLITAGFMKREPMKEYMR